MESIETYETYEKSMLHEHTMIKATATWCGPCQKIHPKIVELANNEKYEGVTFYEYDIDLIDDCPLQEHIRVVPTFLFFEKDKLVHKIKGGDVRGVTNYLNNIVKSYTNLNGLQKLKSIKKQVSTQESESSESSEDSDSSEGSE